MNHEAANQSPHFVVALTGASGTAYGVRLLQVLLNSGYHVHLLVSDAARQVAHRELGCDFPELRADRGTWVEFLSTAFDGSPAAQWKLHPIRLSDDVHLVCHGTRDYSAGIASGSFLTGGMVICPCSMGTLSSISAGASTNLIQRAADVHLKERRPLVVVPRETPLGLIGLENMVRLSQAGATVMPAMPGYYQSPTSVGDLVDFMVARICDHLKVSHNLMARWGDESPLPGRIANDT